MKMAHTLSAVCSAVRLIRNPENLDEVIKLADIVTSQDALERYAVDLNEDPEIALYKEIREECGLKVKILASKSSIAHPGVKPILTPAYMDVHRIRGAHKHIAFVYFGVTKSDRVRLHEREHREFRWVSRRELRSPELRLTRSIRFYCERALDKAEAVK